MASITLIHSIPARTEGGLAGHEAVCSCGLHMTTSLGLGEIQLEAARHIEWHQRTGR